MDDDYRNWGDGDSLDRENVRDIMFEMFPSIKYQKKATTPWFMTDNLCEHFNSHRLTYRNICPIMV